MFSVLFLTMIYSILSSFRLSLAQPAIAYRPCRNWVDNNNSHQAVLGADSRNHRSRHRVLLYRQPPVDRHRISSSCTIIDSCQNLSAQTFFHATPKAAMPKQMLPKTKRQNHSPQAFISLLYLVVGSWIIQAIL